MVTTCGQRSVAFDHSTGCLSLEISTIVALFRGLGKDGFGVCWREKVLKEVIQIAGRLVMSSHWQRACDSDGGRVTFLAARPQQGRTRPAGYHAVSHCHIPPRLSFFWVACSPSLDSAISRCPLSSSGRRDQLPALEMRMKEDPVHAGCSKLNFCLRSPLHQGFARCNKIISSCKPAS